jgi:hypothetical protein
MADDKLRAFGEERVRGSNDATSPDGLRVSTPCGVRAGANNAGGEQFLGCELWVVVIGWQTRVSTPPRLTAFFPIVKRLVAKLIPFTA